MPLDDNTDSEISVAGTRLDMVWALTSNAESSPERKFRLNNSDPTLNETLDPDDWEEFRAFGHQVLDDMVDYIRDVRMRPVWQSPSAASREFLAAPLPRKGSPMREVYRGVQSHILPYPTGNIHPRFWGWVMGSGTPISLLADLIGSAMNCNTPGFDQSATLVERQVIAWLAEMLGFPQDASGLLVSGGTAANLLAVTTARNSRGGAHVRKKGLRSPLAESLIVSGSTATHGWAERCCDLIGIGSDGFCKVAVDDYDRIDARELAQLIRDDRQRGLRPICIVGNAGTVTTGSTDDLNALADLAQSEDLWFHVDGAFGALAKLSPRYSHLADGLERADSVAFDLHKWGYMQYETGAVLIKDGRAHEDAFTSAHSYLETFTKGIAKKPTEFASKGVQLSRSFRALRVWMNLAVYGADRLGAVIERNIDDSQYLASRIQAEPELELLAPAAMNIVCFRFFQLGWNEHDLDALNAEILMQLQEYGIAMPSSTRIRGCFAIRVANTNHRTVRSDFDLLIDAVLQLGGQLTTKAEWISKL